MCDKHYLPVNGNPPSQRQEIPSWGRRRRQIYNIYNIHMIAD